MTWKQLTKGSSYLPRDVRLPFRAIQPTEAKRPSPELRITVLGNLYVGTEYILFRELRACPSLPKKDGNKKITERVMKALSAPPSHPLGWGVSLSGLLLYLREDVTLDGCLVAPILCWDGEIDLHSAGTGNAVIAVEKRFGEVLAIVMPRWGDPPWGGVTFPTGNA